MMKEYNGFEMSIREYVDCMFLNPPYRHCNPVMSPCKVDDSSTPNGAYATKDRRAKKQSLPLDFVQNEENTPARFGDFCFSD